VWELLEINNTVCGVPVIDWLHSFDVMLCFEVNVCIESEKVKMGNFVGSIPSSCGGMFEYYCILCLSFIRYIILKYRMFIIRFKSNQGYNNRLCV